MNSRGLLPAILSCLLGWDASAYCPSYPTVKEEFAQSEVVLIGTVHEERMIPEGETDFFIGTEYAIVVQRVFKGRPSTKLKVFSENSTGRFPMDVGVQYLVFASQESDLLPGEVVFAISSCGNSAPAGTAREAIALLERMRPQLNEQRPTK